MDFVNKKIVTGPIELSSVWVHTEANCMLRINDEGIR